ncbi:MAG: hypothetical protein HW403_1088 [Dehalococcoidia bacterium]|nr:hypothetical protein [Dehalococcoidia bacterium]
MGKLPLEGIRVVDFTWVLSGPTSTLWLSALGAEVIKVESTIRPDTTRIGTAGGYQGVGGFNRMATYNVLNYGKKDITLNMTKPEARELVKEIIKKSDVVIDSYSYGVMERFGLSYEELKALKPDLVVLSKSVMGRSGPEKHIFGFGTTALAYTGLPSITGYIGGEPKMVGGTWPDYVLGGHSAFSIMAALYNQKMTGQGQYIDFCMVEATMAMIPEAILDYTMNGRVRQAQGNWDEAIAPHNVYRCQGDDKWVAIAATNEEEWRGLCGAMGHPEWAKDERFADGYSRLKNREELDPLIEEWTKERTHWDATETLQNAGVPAGPCSNVEDLTNDPHLRERGFYFEMVHPEVGPTEYPGLPIRSTAMEPRYLPAPLIGEHNEYVLREIVGLSDDEIQRLMDEEIVL